MIRCLVGLVLAGRRDRPAHGTDVTYAIIDEMEPDADGVTAFRAARRRHRRDHRLPPGHVESSKPSGRDVTDQSFDDPPRCQTRPRR